MHSSRCPCCACCRGALKDAFLTAAHLLRKVVQWCNGFEAGFDELHRQLALHRDACYLHTLVTLGSVSEFPLCLVGCYFHTLMTMG